MTEADWEKKIGKRIEKLGGLWLKWVCPGYAGVPDRIVLMPGGVIFFAELKRPGRKDGLSPRQKRFLEKLQDLGFHAYRIGSEDEFETALNEVTHNGI